jgi:putative oxidoreductase|tara:strand:+ start:15 stop:467 length:453 start_codon:yes stop_codon:yes gene_type:complete
MKKYFKGPLVILCRLVLGGVFIYASLDKIANPAEFAKAIGNYHVLPFGLENLLALFLPWLELLTGILLIAGIMVDGATILIISMNIVFIFAISQALARGISIECGCFSVSTEGGSNIGFQTILRDFVYLIMAFIIFYRKDKQLEFYPKSV